MRRSSSRSQDYLVAAAIATVITVSSLRNQCYASGPTVALAFDDYRITSETQSMKYPNLNAYPKSVTEFLNANPEYVGKWMKQEPFKDEPIEKGIPDAYFKGRVASDWTNLVNSKLPIVAGSILDIGSGVGGIDIALYNRYQVSWWGWTEPPNLTLIDEAHRKQPDGKIFKIFNVIDIAKDLLLANGVAESKLTTLAVEDAKTWMPDLNRTNVQYDLVLSLRALAYMFPYDYYREFLKKHLAQGGTMILDILSAPGGGLATLDPAVAKRWGGRIPKPQEVIEILKQDFGNNSVEIVRPACGKDQQSLSQGQGQGQAQGQVQGQCGGDAVRVKVFRF